MAATRGSGGTLSFRVLAIIASLIALLVAVAVSTVAVRLEVQRADRQVNDVLTPAAEAAATLTTAWVDEETGERGFILTGDATFLQPYDAGRATVVSAGAKVRRLLRNDAAALALLAAADRAGQEWLTRSAQPEITARSAGKVPSAAELTDRATLAKQRFDDLRRRLAALSSHINHRVSAQLARAHTSQTVATVIALVALGVALGAAAAAALLLRRSLAAPVSRLLAQVEQVAAGDLQQSVATEGPSEVVAIATAVEQMRIRILRDGEVATRSREELARLAESERIARDLHDVVIQRLFGAGMQLESAAARHPDSAPTLRGVVDELDRSIRELRTVIFGLTAHRGDGGLRERVLTLLRDSERSLGFAPQLEVTGPVDSLVDDGVADDVAASLTEILSNIARHANATRARVAIAAEGDVLTLRVSDDGIGLPEQPDASGHGLRNLRLRAQERGGSCAIRRGTDGGTAVELVLPLPRTGTE